MQLTTATPAEIDTVLAGLYAETLKAKTSLGHRVNAVHRAIGERGEYKGRTRTRVFWKTTTEQALEIARSRADEHNVQIGKKIGDVVTSYEEALAALTSIEDEMDILEAEFTRRGGWTRFFYVSGGHIHASRWCSTCNRGNEPTEFGWLPEMSGMDEAKALADLAEKAHTLCTVCFPNAPVLPGAPKKTAAEIAAEKATAAERARVEDPKLIADVDGAPLKVDGDTLRTVRSAEIKAVDSLWWAAFSLRNNADAHTAYEGNARRIAAALAHKRGTTIDAELATIREKATKKVRKDLGADVAERAAAIWAEPVAETPAEPVAETPAEPVAAEPVAEPVAETPAEPVAAEPAPAGPVRNIYREHGKPDAGVYYGCGVKPDAVGRPVTIQQHGMGLTMRDAATGAVVHSGGITVKFWFAPAEQAPTQAELDEAHAAALLEQPQQPTAEQLNPEYRVPQHVLDTDRRLGELDDARRAAEAAEPAGRDDAPAEVPTAREETAGPAGGDDQAPADPSRPHPFTSGEGMRMRCALDGCGRGTSAGVHRVTAWLPDAPGLVPPAPVAEPAPTAGDLVALVTAYGDARTHAAFNPGPAGAHSVTEAARLLARIRELAGRLREHAPAG